MMNSLYNLVNRVTRSFSVRKQYTEYSSLTKAHNILRPHLILSFDCDSPEDAIAAKDISAWLAKRNILSVFAVPGRSLERASGAYADIAAAGHEFMNHGYLDHTEFDRKLRRSVSTTWYHEMSAADVRQDIQRGHATIVKKLGISPAGFRAPHFGYYQSPDQLEIIYSEIARLGYRYSSTTMPTWGFKNGAAYRAGHGIVEFPLTGSYDEPHNVLDSWSYMASPQRTHTPEDYVVQFKKTVDFFTRNALPCILNYYADPSHVVGFKGYFECIEYAIRADFECTTYSRLIESIL